MRPLKASIPLEGKAIDQGYTLVCPECKEIV